MPLPKEQKTTSLTFQCEVLWKRQVASQAALKGKTIQALCVEAISKHLGISPVKQVSA